MCRISSSLSFGVGLVATNAFSCVYRGKKFLFCSIRKDGFLDIVIFQQLLSFASWNLLFWTFLAFVIFVERPAVILRVRLYKLLGVLSLCFNCKMERRTSSLVLSAWHSKCLQYLGTVFFSKLEKFPAIVLSNIYSTSLAYIFYGMTHQFDLLIVSHKAHFSC